MSAQALQVAETVTALEVYSSEDGLKQYINMARDVVESMEPDVTTKKGRDEIASMAAKVSKLKVKLDGFGKEVVSDWKAKSKKVDASRKAMRDEMDELRDRARKPLTEWEAAEDQRIDEHKKIIAEIQFHTRDCHGAERMKLDEFTEFAESMTERDFEEFKYMADENLDKLKLAIGGEIRIIEERERVEKENAELKAKLKAQEEKQEAERLEAAEKQRVVDEAAAKEKREADEKLAAAEAETQRLKDIQEKAEREKREAIEAKERAEQAEKDRIAADKLAAKEAAAEKKRVAAEKKKIAAERDAHVKSLADQLSSHCKTKAAAKELASLIIDGEFQTLVYSPIKESSK